MNRSILSLFAVVSLSLASAACSGAASDDVAASNAADTTESSDTASHIFRAIDANDVAVVNQETTTCANGKRAATCSVVSIDFSALGLTAEATNSLQASFLKGSALAKGTLTQVSHPIGGGSHAIELQPVLTVTEAWTADSDVAVGSFGQFETITKNAAHCDAVNANGSSDCSAIYSVVVVNKKPTTGVAAVDFTASSAKADAIKSTESQLDSGLMVYGYAQGIAGGTMTYEVTAFFLPVSAAKDSASAHVQTMLWGPAKFATCGGNDHCDTDDATPVLAPSSMLWGSK